MSEKELYSKICVAESIEPVAGEPSHNTVRKVFHKISCKLATILARDKEVVAVRLEFLNGCCKAYISKNGEWLDEDVVYINKIEGCLRNISKDSSKVSVEDTDTLTDEILILKNLNLDRTSLREI